jgi:predicted nuclease of predicted toxin-antitoxin system
MRILIDECLPRKLKLDLATHFVQTVPEAGWAAKQNGELLKLAEQEFDVLLTNDQNIEHQQNLKQYNLAFVVLVAATNDINDLRPLMPAINDVLNSIAPGEIRYIRKDL